MEPLQATWLGVAGGVLAIFLWFLKKKDTKEKSKEEQKKEWKDARTSNNRTSMLNILNRLRQKKH